MNIKNLSAAYGKKQILPALCGHQLHADRQSRIGFFTGHSQGGNACKICRNGEEIALVNGRTALLYFKGQLGRDGTKQQIHLQKGLFVFFRNLLCQSTGPLIIGLLLPL